MIASTGHIAPERVIKVIEAGIECTHITRTIHDYTIATDSAPESNIVLVINTIPADNTLTQTNIGLGDIAIPLNLVSFKDDIAFIEQQEINQIRSGWCNPFKPVSLFKPVNIKNRIKYCRDKLPMKIRQIDN